MTVVIAQAERGDLLLIDETAGRIEASRRGIHNTGTLGVLRAAALKGHVDLSVALARLLETNFRVSMELVSALLAEDAERRWPTNYVTAAPSAPCVDRDGRAQRAADHLPRPLRLAAGDDDVDLRRLEDLDELVGLRLQT